MNRKGFSLIELLIVIAIIAVLAGVAVPYYNDYIIDSRTSVLQNNLATIRKALNQFRADNQRGPFKVMVKFTPTGALTPTDLINANPTDGDPFEELVNGPIQNVPGVGWVQRKNIKYLNSKPLLIDPTTGADIPLSKLVFTPGNCYWATTSNSYIDLANDKYFIDSIGDHNYHNFDVNPFNNKVWDNVDASATIDFVDIGINLN